MTESLVEDFNTCKINTSNAFFFSNKKKYQRERETDSSQLLPAVGIGVLLEKDAQLGREVLKRMDQFKLKKEPRLYLDSNLGLECKQEKLVKMHPKSMKKSLFLNIRTAEKSNGNHWSDSDAWYCIDLSKIRCVGDNWVVGKMDLKIKMSPNSPYPIMCAALGSVIYTIGRNSNTTGIYYLDMSNPENEWLEGPSMNIAREMGSVVNHGGKIYVFGGFVGRMKQFGEVYDPVLNSWEPMGDPPKKLGSWQGRFSGIYKSKKILVHPCSDKTLYAYDVEDKSWKVLDRQFGFWNFSGVIMDNVLYVFDCLKLEIRGYCKLYE